MNLKSNSVGDGGCRALGDGLCKLLKLTTLSLDLSHNSFGPEGCRALGDGLCQLLQLTTLELTLFGATGAEVAALREKLRHVPKLRIVG